MTAGYKENINTLGYGLDQVSWFDSSFTLLTERVSVLQYANRNGAAKPTLKLKSHLDRQPCE